MKKWSQDGSIYSLSDVTTHVDALPVGVYLLKKSIFGLYLSKISDKFEFSHKIYGIETDLINRVVKTYNSTNRNLGVLLNGVKGTGKTVTSKLLANALNLPIILIDQTFEDFSITEFLNSIHQNVIISIDEYEKVFGKDAELLTIMDGVMSTESRKVFILTTNETYINENLLQRPGRIRYFKTYKDLPSDTICEVIDDLLLCPEHKEGILKFVSSLEIITIDVLKAIIEEVNIHNEDPVHFKDVFNVKKMTGKFNIIELVENEEKKVTETLFQSGVRISPKSFDQYSEGDNFYIDGEKFGEIEEVLGFDTIIVKVKEEEDADSKSSKSSKKNKKPEIKTFRIEVYDSLHKSFQFGKIADLVF